MERSGVLRWLLLGLAAMLLITFVPKMFGTSQSTQPLRQELVEEPKQRSAERLCDVWGPGFRAQLGTRGASLKNFYLLRAKYRKDGKPTNLSTTPDQEFRRQLRFHWRNPAVAPAKDENWQLRYDTLDWRIRKSNGKVCEFVYEDDRTEIVKVVRSTGRPYELSVEATLKNRSQAPLRHALTVHTTAWHQHKDVEGHMFRVSPLVTRVECLMSNGEDVRLGTTDFDPEKFKEPPFAKNGLNPGDWYQAPTRPDFAAVSNSYFGHALVPRSSPKGTPRCQLQIEQRWHADKYKAPKEDPNGGAMYRAALAYPQTELAPGQSARYSLLSYIGPKERDVLAAAGGGDTQLGKLIDLGFFSVIAKVLVAFLLQVYGVIPNWGIAIIILTLTARTLLFPLSIPSIKSMIKMRELKPELDELNKKYKEDPQARGLAQMELWRKHKVNPFIGCLPQLATMPVWIALYTTLQTAVELYNIPFLWFPDLSQPDGYYVLPFIIGGTSFVQQKIMPMQGGDPAQQKMMLYFMPGMFTVFMLFLPSGLGVYMFTNSLLGIVQQQAVEWHARRTTRSKNQMAPQGDQPAAKSASTSGASGSRSTSGGKPRGKGKGKRRKEPSGPSAKVSQG